MDKVGPSKTDGGGPPGGAPLLTQDPVDPHDGTADQKYCGNDPDDGGKNPDDGGKNPDDGVNQGTTDEATDEDETNANGLDTEETDAKGLGIVGHFNRNLLWLTDLVFRSRGRSTHKRTNVSLFPEIEQVHAKLVAAFQDEPNTDAFIRPIADWVYENRVQLAANDDKLFLQPKHDFLKNTLPSAKLWRSVSPNDRKVIWERIETLAQMTQVFSGMNHAEGTNNLHRKLFGMIDDITKLASLRQTNRDEKVDIFRVANEYGLPQKIRDLVSKANSTIAGQDNLSDLLQTMGDQLSIAPRCQKCGNNQIQILPYLRRSEDEGASHTLHCAKCNHLSK